MNGKMHKLDLIVTIYFLLIQISFPFYNGFTNSVTAESHTELKTRVWNVYKVLSESQLKVEIATEEVESIYEDLIEEGIYIDENISFEDDSNQNVILQILIFMCCAAGVFGLCIICCIVCGQLFNPITNRNRRIRSFRESVSPLHRTENTDAFVFVSTHHHPWSPEILEESQTFHFEIGKNDDKPPSYEDLESTNKQEEPYSPLPPPYTPSFLDVYEKETSSHAQSEETFQRITV